MPDTAYELFEEYNTDERRLGAVADFLFSRDAQVAPARKVLDYTQRKLNEVERDVNNLPWLARGMTPALINALQFGIDIVLPSSNVEMLLAAVPIVGAARAAKKGMLTGENLLDELPKLFDKYYNVEKVINPDIERMGKAAWKEDQLGEFFTKFLDPDTGPKKLAQQFNEQGAVPIDDIEKWLDADYIKLHTKKARAAGKEARATTGLQSQTDEGVQEVGKLAEEAAQKAAAPVGQLSDEALLAQTKKETMQAVLEDKLTQYFNSGSPSTVRTLQALKTVAEKEGLPSAARAAFVKRTLGQEIKGIGKTAKELKTSAQTVGRRIKQAVEGGTTPYEVGKTRSFIQKYPNDRIRKAVNEVVPDPGLRDSVWNYLQKPGVFTKGKPSKSPPRHVPSEDMLDHVGKVLEFLAKPKT